MATIQGVYVALFGRPADPTGLAYFNGVTNNGANLSAINNLAGQKEYTDRFAGQNNVQIVNSIYQSLFGRDAEAGGLNFFVDALNKGTLNINNIAIAILDGAQGSDKTIADNKVAAANLFTAALDTPTEIGSYTGNGAAAIARGWLAGVTTTAATQASADAAIKAVVDGGAAGNTIALVTGSETLNLTTGIGTPAVTTTNNNDTINGGTVWDPTAAKIDGGLGTDTFNATVNALAFGASGKLVADGLKNVEIINLTPVTAASTLDLTEAKQATQVWNVKGAAAAVNLGVQGLALSTAVGVKGDVGATATTFAFADVTSSSDTATLALNGATVSGAGTITIVGVETLNVSNSGSSSIVGLTTVAAKTVNVSGSGSLNLGTAATTVNIETLNAADFTGSLTVSLTAQTAIKAVNGGAGSDKITVDVDSTNLLSVNGGAGADTITLLAGGAAATKAITLTGGDGSDIFELGVAATAAGNVNLAGANTVTSSLVTIADFNKAQDAIKASNGAAGTDRDVLLDAELAAISSKTTLLEAAQEAALYTDVGKVSIFNFGTDAYIFTNGNTQAFETGDTLVKVTGATVADFTASNFQVI